MAIKGVDKRARFALVIFVIALLSTIGFSVTFYLRTSRDLKQQRLSQTRIETLLLSSTLSKLVEPSNAVLAAELRKYGISGRAFLYSNDGSLVAASSNQYSGSDTTPVPPDNAQGRPTEGPHPEQVSIRTEKNLAIGEAHVGQSYILVLARPLETEPLYALFYILLYQLIAVLVGIAIIAAIITWVLRPYRRMVEAARGSPVRASAETSESQFVVETFQALITQLQAKERELAEMHRAEKNRAERSERFSERLVANLPSGLVVVSSDGFVTAVNKYAARLFAASENSEPSSPSPNGSGNLELLNTEFKLFFKNSPRLADLVARCLADGVSFQREEADIEEDGRLRHIGLSISPITDTSHKVEAALCLMTDITEVTELRDRMKLQENLANLGEMAAGLAHEFKNSLATIQGFIQLLEARLSQNGTEDSIRGTLDATLNEVRVLAQLVTDFLNFARPQKLALGTADLRSVLEIAADDVQQLMLEHGIEFRIDGSFPSLRADESLLRRAFSNLLRNATESIDPASGRKLIEVTGSIDTGRSPRYAHVRIEDTGCGIPGENLNNIFIPFFTTKSRGYGIGLALVQKIMVAHGGAVSVEKSDESGTIFHCRLPLPADDVEITAQIVN